eukprot:m.24069 g.24069  ORF g.24069 m.24069 type:complete len:96 (-) comp35823_c0_seq2:28-315(-)
MAMRTRPSPSQPLICPGTESNTQWLMRGACSHARRSASNMELANIEVRLFPIGPAHVAGLDTGQEFVFEKLLGGARMQGSHAPDGVAQLQHGGLG